MSFSEFELKYIENTLGSMCKRRSPVHLRDELRTVYKVKGHDVTVYEERPRWNNPREWASSELLWMLNRRAKGIDERAFCPGLS
jgi:hypothetical protein